ncbi:hypothetical protein pb186bvf_014735 [Paramecium bursaria]
MKGVIQQILPHQPDKLFLGGLMNLQNFIVLTNQLNTMKKYMNTLKQAFGYQNGRIFKQELIICQNVKGIPLKSINELQQEFLSKIEEFKNYSQNEISESRILIVSIDKLKNYINLEKYRSLTLINLVEKFKQQKLKGKNKLLKFYSEVWRQITINKRSFIQIIEQLLNYFGTCSNEFPLRDMSIQQFYLPFLQNAMDNIFHNENIIESEHTVGLLLLFGQLQRVVLNEQSIESTKKMIIFSASILLLSTSVFDSKQFIFDTIQGHYLFDFDCAYDFEKVKLSDFIEMAQKRLQESKMIVIKINERNSQRQQSELKPENIQKFQQQFEIQQQEINSKKKQQIKLIQKDIDEQKDSGSSNQSSLPSNFQSHGADNLQLQMMLFQKFETTILPEILNNWNYISAQLKKWFKFVSNSQLFKNSQDNLSKILHLKQYKKVKLQELKLKFFYIQNRAISGFTTCDGFTVVNLYVFCLNQKFYEGFVMGENVIRALISYVLLVTLHESAHYMTRISSNNWQYCTADMTKIVQEENDWLKYRTTAEAGEIFESLMLKSIFFPEQATLNLEFIPNEILIKATDEQSYFQKKPIQIQQQSNHGLWNFKKK